MGSIARLFKKRGDQGSFRNTGPGERHRPRREPV